MPSWQRRAHESYDYNLKGKKAEFCIPVHVFASSPLSTLVTRAADAVNLPPGGFPCQGSLRVAILGSNGAADCVESLMTS
jgi:hypothetical protein